MRILLTGAQGQVGQAIIRQSRYYPAIDLIALNKTECNIADKISIEKNIENYFPDVIINCAAFTAVDTAEDPLEREKVDSVNVKGPKNLAKICQEKNIYFMHLSTDYVFDGFKKTAYVETDATNPINYYGKSKLLGEEEIKNNTDKYLILRVSWVFSMYAKNPLKNLIKLMQEKEMLNMVSDQITCPTYAGDIAETLLGLAVTQNDTSGVFHYCNPAPLSRYDLACWIRETASKIAPLKVKEIIPITTEQFQTPAIRPKNSVLNCEYFSNTFHMPIKGWQESMKNSIEEMMNAK